MQKPQIKNNSVHQQICGLLQDSAAMRQQMTTSGIKQDLNVELMAVEKQGTESTKGSGER